ncbi:unnamed protein product [Kuraishia capsulata CBS 1993]|uniref:PX domain-containing protein n=1 Tax=Kuraishia capsulata CBS 1993 TaxID=1382522 RepID=W6MIJ2_9ASCO|nr:uncharacterized protein KUCA_T00001698001 [Kuraishia capsulata CBS 1993]CDK25728.1 unnamed protein product [Kuraishia capsulata CBS 1993]
MDKFEVSIYSTSTTESYTVYHIRLLHGVNVYRTSKRYSDFVRLKSDLEGLRGQAMPYQLPRKHYITKSTDPGLIEERRVSLEEFLGLLMKDETWRDNDVMRSFLGLPNSAFRQASVENAVEKAENLKGVWKSDAADGPMSPNEWFEMLRDCKSLLQDCRSRMFSGSTVECRKSLSSTKSRLVKLQEVMNDPQGWGSLGAGELKRRQDLLVELQRDYDDLQTLLTEMASDHSAVGKHPLSSSGRSEAYTQLFQGSSPVSKSNRVLGGKPQETSVTRQLDNGSLLQFQKDEIQNQDQQLNSLRSIIQRQRQIGVAINEELNVQKDILDALDQQVDDSTAKMKSARQKIGKILQ